MNTNSKATELGAPLSSPHERNEERSPAPYRHRVGEDPIHEAFAEHRKALKQRDELVAALTGLVNSWHFALSAKTDDKDKFRAAMLEARAALAKVQA